MMKKLTALMLSIFILFGCCAIAEQTDEDISELNYTYDELLEMYTQLKKDYEELREQYERLLENSGIVPEQKTDDTETGTPEEEETSDEKETEPSSVMDLTHYAEGQYKVGMDIPAGEYMILATGNRGYFCLSSDANENNIIQNDNFSTNSIITVRNGEYIKLSRCIAFSADEFYKYYSIKKSAEGAMFKIGYDLGPGEYKLIANSGQRGYYCIYDSSRQDNIVANDNFSGSTYVKVSLGQYLTISRCTIAG